MTASLPRLVLGLLAAVGLLAAAHAQTPEPVYKAGHPSLKAWRLPPAPPAPADNLPNAERVALGRTLFFDPRLSGDGNMSCATCHNPSLGWSDGQATARGVKSMTLGRATPTIVNTGYNSLQMWDGRKKSLEDQAMGPMEATVEMNMDIARLFRFLNENQGYRRLFAKAYPGEAIDAGTLSKAIATYERTIVSRTSPFDRWVAGDAKAMTAQQVEGFRLFNGKAACAACHSGPNFTDNGFHNLGLKSFGVAEPDPGRYAIRPVKAMKGAFKTPTLRDVTRTGPYFHDGSAATLMDVMRHYDRGGDVTTNLSPNMKPLSLTEAEMAAVVAFMEALTSPYRAEPVPELPRH
jgi:cytochrome c peroxidase